MEMDRDADMDMEMDRDMHTVTEMYSYMCLYNHPRRFAYVRESDNRFCRIRGVVCGFW